MTHLVADIRASLVVFLVALPLCVGVAVASGVPAELGVITGIVGGLVAGALPGSALQVSGPAAGLTVLMADAVSRHGLAALGLLVCGAGVIQLGLGALRLGTWFQAISPSVVQGMLAGIGLVLMLGQLYPLFGAAQPKDILDKLMSLPGLVTGLSGNTAGLWSLGLGVAALGVIMLWPRLPKRFTAVPAPLVAVVVASTIAATLALPAPRVVVGSVLNALRPPLSGTANLLTDPAIWATMLTIAIVASAESLFSAAAVDRLHDGEPTRYNAELMAQGSGNVVCGLLGSLPMTAVIVRSAANVQAGARTRASRILHGVWLLLFAVALPGVIAMVPLSVLAALLLHAGWKLLDPSKLARRARHDRAEAGVTAITAITIFGIDLLSGVLLGLGLAVVLAAWRLSHLSVVWHREDDYVRVQMRGNATFLRLPQLLRSLDAVPAASFVELDVAEVRHLDDATRATLREWIARRRRADCVVQAPLLDAA